MVAAPGTLDIVWSAYRSVLSRGGRLAYVSAPITTGRRVLDGCPRGDAIKLNLAEGTALAREIAGRVDEPVVAPTIFTGRPQEWSQADYMAMWLRMIEECVDSVYMSPGWEYSNGCAEEYLRAVNLAHGFGSRADVCPRLPNGAVLHLHEGMARLAEALHLFHERGQRAETQASVFLGLYAAYTAWRAIDVCHELPTQHNAEVVDGANGDEVSRLVRSTAALLRRDYAWDGSLALTFNDGAVRKLSAWPEGVVPDLIGDEQC